MKQLYVEQFLENKHKNVDREAATNIISNKSKQNQVNESIKTVEFRTL